MNQSLSRHLSPALLIAALAAPAGAQTSGPTTPADSFVVPAPVGFVNDFAHVLTPADKAALTRVIEEVRTKCRAEIAVVTLASLKGASAADAARRIGNTWGVGPNGPPNDPTARTGAVVLLAPADHQYRLELADGARFITNDAAHQLLDAEMVPPLRHHAYGQALRRTVQAVAQRYADHFGFTLAADARQ